ncbi:MAG: DUF3604 domain-containing protein [Planctomycetota bacterium]
MQSDLGCLRLENGGPITAGSCVSRELIYTVPAGGIGGSARLYIGFDERQRVGRPQTQEAGKPNYVSAATSEGQKLEVETGFVLHGCGSQKCSQNEFTFTSDYEPLMTSDYHLVIIRLGGHVGEGEQIRILIGDRSEGSCGFCAPRSNIDEFTFHGFVDLGDGVVRRIADPPSASVKPAGEEGALAVIPSVLNGGKVRLGVTGLDRYKNPARNQCVIIDSNAKEIAIGQFQGGWHEDTNRPALRCVRLSCDESGCKEIQTNYALVQGQEDYNLYWGDVHGHCNIGDGGARSVDEYYGYARDFMMLDFCALAEHSYACAIGDNWQRIQEAAKKYNEQGRFVTFIGSESMVKMRNTYGGHKVHIFPGQAAPLLQADTQPGFEKLFEIGIYKKLLNSEAVICKSIEELWERLSGIPSLTINHHCWAGADFFNPKLERLYEIHSKWGTSETRDWPTPTLQMGVPARQLLNSGLKIGFVGCSDTHDGRPGGPQKETAALHYPGGITAVWAKQLSREDIYQGLWARRCYATTGERLLLKADIYGHMMGDEFDVEGEVELEISGAGTCELDRIDIIRNGQVVFTELLSEETAKVKWKDKDAGTGEHYYYVRLRQDDGHIAWSSPFFVTIKQQRLIPARCYDARPSPDVEGR